MRSRSLRWRLWFAFSFAAGLFAATVRTLQGRRPANALARIRVYARQDANELTDEGNEQ